MAETRIPDALAMKALKYGDRPDSEKDALASTLMARGRRAEALLLFEGRGDHPIPMESRRWAVEEGASFHLLALQRLGTPVTEEDIRVCGVSAERKGRWIDAHRCWTILGDAEGLARVSPHLPPSMQAAESASEAADA